jgi:predicted dehydrogenase
MDDKLKPIRVLIVGCGNMGTSHAIAYQSLKGFEICGIVSRGDSKNILNKKLGGNYPLFNELEALTATKPDAVCISISRYT